MAHLVKFFKGRPVRTVRRVDDSTDVLLTFLNPVPGQPRETLRVTQEEMQKHYEKWEVVEDRRTSDLRPRA